MIHHSLGLCSRTSIKKFIKNYGDHNHSLNKIVRVNTSHIILIDTSQNVSLIFLWDFSLLHLDGASKVLGCILFIG